MYHSINIGPYNTYALGLIPDGRPVVKPPTTKTTFVDVPGADGSLDYTEVLNGLKYENRKGSWDFYVLRNNQSFDEKAWSNHYSEILKSIHGKYFDSIWLEDDSDEGGNPLFTYRGRVYVNDWKSDKTYSKIVLDYDLEPYKYPVSTDTTHPDWLWDDLTNGETVSPDIKYGRFIVDGTKDRTIFGSGEISIYCSTSDMVVSFYNNVHEPIHLESGMNNEVFNIDDLTSSVTKGLRVSFSGAGQVELYYGEGRKL